MSFSKIGTLMVVLAVSACGFHLKGMGGVNQPLPYTAWQITQTQELEEYLHDELKRHSVTVVRSGNAADAAEIHLLKLERSRDVGSLSRIGTVSEYILTLKVAVAVHFQGEDKGEPIFVTLQRKQSYLDNDLFGKQQEEQALWDDMYQDAAVQIVRRLPYIQAHQ